MIGDFWDLLVLYFGFRNGNLTLLVLMLLLFLENRCENLGSFWALIANFKHKASLLFFYVSISKYSKASLYVVWFSPLITAKTVLWILSNALSSSWVSAPFHNVFVIWCNFLQFDPKRNRLANQMLLLRCGKHCFNPLFIRCWSTSHAPWGLKIH